MIDSNSTLKPGNMQPTTNSGVDPQTALDKSRLPAELSVKQNAVQVATILALAPHIVVEFKYGDYVPNADAFNNYLEANIQPGGILKMTKIRVVQLIKQLAMTLNTGGLSSLPMICLNDSCPRAADCPIRSIGETPPIGQACPVERSEALHHVRGLAKDFGEGRSYADQLMIQGVAGVQLLKARVYADLATNPEPIMEWEKGIDGRGNVLREKGENPNFKILERLLKQEQVLLKGLHLTQEQRIKLQSGKIRSADQLIGDLRDKLNTLKRTHKTEGLEILEAQLVQEGELLNEEIHNQPGSAASGEPASTADIGAIGPNTGAAGDLRESVGNVATTKRDYRSDKSGRTSGPSKSYLGQSPFGGGGKQAANPHTGPNANSMEEAS